MSLRVLWSVTVSCALLPAAAAADTLVLLDNSGSMAERMAGSASKAEEAAAALAAHFLPGLPAGEHAALWAFGGNCRGLQLQGAFRLGRQMQQDVAQVGAPRGSTPLARSIALALAELQNRPTPRHLVVLTDGLDTCGEDPCAAARGSGAHGAEITIHTVGLDMRRDGREFRVLQCIADAGEGGTARVLEPGSSGRQLGDVLAAISSSLKEPTGELLVRLRDPGGEERADVGFVAESVADGIDHRGTTGKVLSLPPGHYRLSELDRSSTVIVAAGQRKVVDISSPLGRLNLEPECARGETFALLDETGGTIATGVLDGSTSFDLPPGGYQLVLARFAHQPQRVVVREGRLSSLAVGGLGTLHVEGHDAAGEPVELPVEVFDDSSPPDAPSVAAGRTNHAFRLPAGAYNVVVSRERDTAAHFPDALNVRVSPCQQTVTSLHQRAALRVCAPPGKVEIWSEPDGRLLEATAGIAVPLDPGRYNLVLSDGSYVPNVVVERGETTVGCR